MRIFGRLLLVLVLLGLVAGWIARGRIGRERLPLLVALAFAPAALHAIGITWWSAALGLEPVWVVGYGVTSLLLMGLAWWWMRGAIRTRPFVAGLAVPGQAFVQFALASLLGRMGGAAETAAEVLPGVALVAASVVIAAALVVLLPSRDHFPRLGIRAPAWWRALGRTFRGRR